MISAHFPRCAVLLRMGAAMAVLLATGCQPTHPPNSPTMAAPVGLQASSALNVQSSTEVVEAQRLFGKGDFAESMKLLDKKLKSGKLEPPEIDYLKTQRDICAAKLGGKPLAKALQEPKTTRLPEQADCGVRALTILCEAHKVPADRAKLRTVAGTTGFGTTLEGLEKAAKSLGFETESLQMNLPALQQLKSPAIAWSNGDHYVAVLSVDGETATIRDPNKPKEELVETQQLLAQSGGILLIVRKAVR